jgi:hypothetical protein
MAASSTGVVPVNATRPPMIPWPQTLPSPAAREQNRTALQFPESVRYHRSFTFKLLLEQMEHPALSRQHYRAVFRFKGIVNPI